VEDVIAGCVSPNQEQGGNIARLALLAAGFPQKVPGVQLNRMCGSGQQAVHFAAQAIAAGDMDIVIGCGIEMMSVVKMGSDMNDEAREKVRKLVPFKVLNQGQSAELISEKYNITKDELNALAVRSHELSHKATEAGYVKPELFPIQVPKKDQKTGAVIEPRQYYTLDKDEGIRYPADISKMKTLPTPFKKDGKITPAHASQISDGAGAVMLMSESKMKELGIKPLAKIIARTVVGSDPELMLTGPIEATRNVLKKAGMTLDQIDRIEINEAFGSVVVAWQKELKADMSKVNVNGGAIAHGHPLGATGAILMTKLVYELKRTGLRYGLQTMCIGWGMATATIIENCDAKGYKEQSKL